MPYLFIVILVFTFLICSTYLVKLSRYEIRSCVKSEFKFVHISDIHGTTQFLNGKLSERINDISPDMVFITGDLANNHKQLPKVLKELCEIEAPDGIFLVLGNYEEQEGCFRKKIIGIESSIAKIKANAKLTLLVNDYRLVTINGNKVLVYGFDNSTYGHEQYNNDVDLIEYDYKCETI